MTDTQQSADVTAMLAKTKPVRDVIVNAFGTLKGRAIKVAYTNSLKAVIAELNRSITAPLPKVDDKAATK